ncbi:uncharacterized protein F5147DRAFT_841670 [Suillus discolor]|uniref:Uncharacterized protein n=1 Tax=Suillus discolor TaxID=1912936 RepID=A0A9P7JLB7_9AGAM|nr:uncharacterized protein F5147DRAFT_841670 [Suillus discolor]KAG2085821.1 hypothetical protein F5147DRAFT_841670 [Suillus discolor]
MSQQDLDLPDIDWPEVTVRNTILGPSVSALTKVNNWSIRHPYVAVGALMLISANPDLLFTPLRLAGKTTLYICDLPPVRYGLIVLPFKLKLYWRILLYTFISLRSARQKIAKGVSYVTLNMADSLASQRQRHLCGGYVPRDSTFARSQSYGAAYDMEEALRLVEELENRDRRETGSILGVGVSWLSGIGAVFVLGRRWWWN